MNTVQISSYPVMAPDKAGSMLRPLCMLQPLPSYAPYASFATFGRPRFIPSLYKLRISFEIKFRLASWGRIHGHVLMGLLLRPAFF
jgi:hypothetical protein